MLSPPAARRSSAAGSRSRQMEPGVRAARALAAMPTRDCALLGLLLVERMSLAEAAETLGVTVHEVRRRYDAAVARVRRALAPVRARRIAAASAAARADIRKVA